MLLIGTLLMMQIASESCICQFNKDLLMLYQAIQTPNGKLHFKAVELVTNQRIAPQHFQKVLIHIIEHASTNDRRSLSAKHTALYALVNLNLVDYQSDSKLIDLFINNIDIYAPPTMFERGLRTTDYYYPSIRGLLLIGQRTTEPLFVKLKSTDDKNILTLIAFWFKKYYGRRMALSYFQANLDVGVLNLDERKRVVWVVEQIEAGSE